MLNSKNYLFVHCLWYRILCRVFVNDSTVLVFSCLVNEDGPRDICHGFQHKKNTSYAVFIFYLEKYMKCILDNHVCACVKTVHTTCFA